MKKFFIVSLLLATLAFSQMAHAAWYTCNLTMVTPQTVAATDTAATPAFTNRAFAFPTTTATRNQFMAIALTALSSGKQVMLSLSSTDSMTTLASIVVLP